MHTEVDLDTAKREMIELLAEDRVDKPRIFQLQKDTMTARRKWMRNLKDCDVQSLADEYPILLRPDFIEREVEELMRNSKLTANMSTLVERLDEVLTRLDRHYMQSGSAKDMRGDDDEASAIDTCQKVADSIKWSARFSKKHKPVLSRMSVSTISYNNCTFYHIIHLDPMVIILLCISIS